MNNARLTLIAMYRKMTELTFYDWKSQLNWWSSIWSASTFITKHKTKIHTHTHTEIRIMPTKLNQARYTSGLLYNTNTQQTQYLRGCITTKVHVPNCVTQSKFTFLASGTREEKKSHASTDNNPQTYAKLAANK